MKLLEPLAVGSAQARNRIVFGPHETNLGRGRRFSERHVAYYRRRAAGGAGIVVTEEASVHPSDWPYERAPLAAECAEGWAEIARACQGEGALVVAALGHSGGQGSSAYHQGPLWAPSDVPEVNTREVPMRMRPRDIAEVVEGFGAAAAAACAAGVDGVEVNAGQHSLVRQFCSGLTNLRDDEWGANRLRFAREVLAAVRAGAGRAIVGLRLSCDELAPWAGITPEAAADVARELSGYLDYLVVVRGSIFSVAATRPDTHTEPGFNLATTAALRAVLDARVAVIAQGSLVDMAQAEHAVASGAADAVEATRALIADGELPAKLAAGHAERIRPCVLCNQTCQVRDGRNPLVSCVVDPTSGHEWEDPALPAEASSAPAEPSGSPSGPEVLVVGGGVAGLECARVAALAGYRVTVAERDEHFGGMLRIAAAGAGRAALARFADWLEAECRALGVELRTGWTVTPRDVTRAGGPVVCCTGSRPGWRSYAVDDDGVVIDAADVLAGHELADGPVAVWDPIGGPIGISVAESLAAAGRTVHLLTPDLLPGTLLSRTGDLAPASVRLMSAGVAIERRCDLVSVSAEGVTVADHFSAEQRVLPAVALVDAGARLPDDSLWRATGASLPRAGDAVAPRSVYEAVLEGRRVALSLPVGTRALPVGARAR